ncbi:MAG: M20/M25/M40 family metallo-hydrolase [Thermoplasmata archaeon]
MDLDSVNSRIDREIKKHIAATRKLLKQPSSSQQDIGIEECADLVSQLYTDAGCEKVEVIGTKGNPIVYGECKGESKRTLLVYFMYDTMPFNEPGWKHPPMGAKIVPMKLPAGMVKALVNRGACNTKGPLAAFLNSLRACNESVGRPPVSLIFVAEGEEELGSPSLPAYVKKDKKRLSRASACYFPYCSQESDGALRLNLGVKGNVYFELECSGKSWGRGPQEFPIHSLHKAWIDSPVWRLIDALGTMAAENGKRILIDGFYDKVGSPSEEEEEVIAATAKNFDTRALKAELRFENFMYPEDDKADLIRKFSYGTTLNIDGIWGGWTEKGSKTVLPDKATCKIDIRLVPNQRKQDMLRLVRTHLDNHGYGDIKMREVDAGYDWCKCSVREPVVQAMIRSMRAFVGEPSIWPTSGGAVPFYVFNRALKLPFTMGGIGHSGLAHSPNEYMVVEGNKKIAGLPEVEKFFVHFMNELAQCI